MGQIFISHSSLDNTHAEAMRDWLKTEGWSDVFLDLDASVGLAPGQRWREELRKAGERCSAVVVLVSAHWANSKWCLAEFLFAAQLGKEVFPVLVEPCSFESLPIELTATYQFADISTPDKRAGGLERLRIGLQRAGLHPGAFNWPPKGEPNRPVFRGLRVLEEQDAAIFFGRDTQITKAMDAVRRLRDGAPERMLVILGASGAGKSSFLRAGLLARLKRDTERFLVLPTVRPGLAAVTGPTGLRQALGLSGALDVATIAAQIARLSDAVVEQLRHLGPPPGTGSTAVPLSVVLPIDQAEELFVAGDVEAAQAIDLIAQTLSADPRVILLLTIRSDSFGLLQGDSRLSGISRLPFDLAPLSAASFKEVIQGPTRLQGVGVEIDDELTEQLIQDFEGADALPLLAFTLERLVADYSSTGHLGKRQYLDEMKGVGGAIRAAVERAFAKAAQLPGLPSTRAALDELAQRSFVPGLVRIDDITAPAKRRIALRRDLPPEALPLIDCLVDERLLVADTVDGERTVEVSHEAVLRHWRELDAWIATRRGELSLSERITAAADDWRKAESSAKDDALVHRGERLRAAEALLGWDNLGWKQDDYRRAYLSACRNTEERAELAAAAQRRRQKLLLRWVSGLVGLAALVTVIGAVLVVSGQRNLGRSTSITLAAVSSRLAADWDAVRALHLAILAVRSNGLISAIPEALAALSSAAQSSVLLVDLRGHHGPVYGAVFSVDQDRILTWSEDGTARLWEAATGVQIGPNIEHGRMIKGAVFSADQKRILTWNISARLWDAATGAQIGPALQHDGVVLGAVFSADQHRILTWSADGTARLWDAATGAQISPVLKHDTEVNGAVFSADQHHILTWSADGTARLWDAASGAQIGPALKHDKAVGGAVFSADQQRILTWSNDGTARLWDAASGVQIGPDLKHDWWVYGAVFSADQQRILTWSYDSTARLWDAASGAQIGPDLKHDGWVNGAVFSADQQRILTWSNDGTARLWDAASGVQIGPDLKHDGWVNGAVFSADQHRILTWGRDGTARLWNVASGAQIGPALKHDRAVNGAVFSADQKRVLTWSDDRTARLWEATTGAQIGPDLKHDTVYGAVFSADQKRILTWSRDGKAARLWEATTGTQIGLDLEHGGLVEGAVFSADQMRILTWSDDGTARLWEAATGAQIGPDLKHDRAVNGAVFSADQKRVLTWSDDRTARLWDAASGVQIGPKLDHGLRVRGAVFSVDQKRILTWSRDGTMRLWDAASGAQIGPDLKHDRAVNGAVFSADQKRVLTWSSDSTARLWEAASGAQIGRNLEHGGMINGAVFSADQKRILTWSDGGTARLWDAATGVQIGSDLGRSDSVKGAVFSTDQKRILTWSDGGTARLWEAATGAQIGPDLKHDRAVNGAVFSADQKRVLTWSKDRTARLWEATTGAQIGPNLEHGRKVNEAAFSTDQKRILTWSEDGTARLWGIEWAMRDPTAPEFIDELCRKKLVGASLQSEPVDPKRQVGVRHIDAVDIAAAPILRDREGQDVCAAPPTKWELLLYLVGMSKR